MEIRLTTYTESITPVLVKVWVGSPTIEVAPFPKSHTKVIVEVSIPVWPELLVLVNPTSNGPQPLPKDGVNPAVGLG